LCELFPGDGESIRKVVEGAFGLTETVLKNQREFARSVLDRPTSKPTTHKAAAKLGAA
jgi:hypothetical protein